MQKLFQELDGYYDLAQLQEDPEEYLVYMLHDFAGLTPEESKSTAKKYMMRKSALSAKALEARSK